MRGELTAIIKKEGEWWLGWVEEIPGANAQEKTKEELMVSLREAANDIFELRCEESRKQAANEYEEISGSHALRGSQKFDFFKQVFHLRFGIG